MKTREEAAIEALSKFMNTGTPDTDDYWCLFKVKDEVNDALVRAVEYGYKKGHTAGIEWLESQASEGFDEWFKIYQDAGKSYKITPESAYYAGRISAQKEIADKEKQIQDAKDLVRELVKVMPYVAQDVLGDKIKSLLGEE